MYDAARLFGDFGLELKRLAWQPGDLFDVPHGVVWFIKGNYAAAIGATMAQLGRHERPPSDYAMPARLHALHRELSRWPDCRDFLILAQARLAGRSDSRVTQP
jgi:hypothetical protein